MNEANEQARRVARKIIKRLSADIWDRDGLGDEWIQISPKVMKNELVPAWTKIIVEEVAKASGQQAGDYPTEKVIAGSLKQPGSVQTVPSLCETREGIGLCDDCGKPKWPQKYMGYGCMVCLDCIDAAERKALNDAAQRP